MKVTAEKYREKTGIEPKIYVCTAENGAGVIV